MQLFRRFLALTFCLALVSASYAAPSVKVSGTWQPLTSLSAKVSGTWQDIQHGYVKVSGVWEEFYSACSFAPHTDTYSTGGDEADITVPCGGATQLVIKVYGAGMRGADATNGDGDWYSGNGGDGGNRVIKTISLAAGDVGSTLHYKVGSSNSYANSTVVGTLAVAGSVSIASGTGSTHSGGDSFSTGSSGTTGGILSGGAPSGGAGVDGHGQGGEGAPGTVSATGQDGDNGYIELIWS